MVRCVCGWGFHICIFTKLTIGKKTISRTMCAAPSFSPMMKCSRKILTRMVQIGRYLGLSHLHIYKTCDREKRIFQTRLFNLHIYEIEPTHGVSTRCMFNWCDGWVNVIKSMYCWQARLSVAYTIITTENVYSNILQTQTWLELIIINLP